MLSPHTSHDIVYVKPRNQSCTVETELESEYTMQDSGFDSDAGSFINCSNLDEQSIRLLALMRGLTGIVCFLVCLATLLLVLSRRCLASLRESTQARLMAYLLLSTVAYLLVLSMHLEHYWTNSGSGNHTARRAYWEVRTVSL